MRTLRTKDRPTKLSFALQKLGWIIKTLYLVNYIAGEDYRRRILTQLNCAKAAMRSPSSFSTDSEANCDNAIVKDRKISSGLSAW